MKKFEEAQSITQPVIYVGAEKQEAKGFDKVEVYVINPINGVIESESHYSGEVSIQMVNGTLKIFLES